ncbi:ubiquinol-cytochrome-c reductase complex assembly factor 2 isoform X3 [Eublepharis macularius]|nr:ubiquinol-cytochrome-c reductase complex assembly factor 2 isoform X3 [Eublepharis macularius]
MLADTFHRRMALSLTVLGKGLLTGASGSVVIADPVTCDEMFDSLARIHTNYYKNKYPRWKDTSFTGVTVEECKMVLATDSLKQMEEAKKGKWTKLREKFSAKTPEEDSK